MKKVKSRKKTMSGRIVLFLLALTTSLLSSARDFEYTYKGQTLTYTVLDEDAKTVQAKGFQKISGDLILPEHPKEGEVEYTLRRIGDYAFYRCSSLTSVTIPNSVTVIDLSAFWDCSSLTSITIPNSVIVIGESAFQGCSSLTSITIPNSVIVIGKFAFQGCSSLTSVTIPNSVTEISESAFYRCSSLTSITIPNSVTVISSHAFANCSSLSSITIPNSVTKIDDSAFSRCSSLTSVTIPNSVTVIGGAAFYRCSSLTSVTIPNSVTVIGASAFFGCSSLTSVAIPNSVTEIGDYAFYECSNLNKVICLSEDPPILESDCFKEGRELLYVPKGSIAKYENSDWAKYFNSIEELPGGISIEISGNGSVYSQSFGAVENGAELDGSDFSLFILPNDDNYISSITLGGENIMSDLVNHKLTLSNNECSGVLKVTFAETSEATLAVKGADNHSFIHTYKEGTSAVIGLIIDNDWELHSLTFNKEDVTPVVENNIYVTEPLHGNNFLNMVLVKRDVTDIDDISSTGSDVHISVSNSTVTISGLDSNEPVSVFDISGKVIYKGFERQLTLKSGNIYILTTPANTYKIAL